MTLQTPLPNNPSVSSISVTDIINQLVYTLILSILISSIYYFHDEMDSVKLWLERYPDAIGGYKGSIFHIGIFQYLVNQKSNLILDFIANTEAEDNHYLLHIDIARDREDILLEMYKVGWLKKDQFYVLSRGRMPTLFDIMKDEIFTTEYSIKKYLQLYPEYKEYLKSK